MDGIKPNVASTSKDDTLASAPVTVDLLHPSEVANEPSATTAGPVPTAVVSAPFSPVTPPAPSPRISPITPPRIAPLDPTYEMVYTTPVPQAPSPIVADVKVPQQKQTLNIPAPEAALPVDKPVTKPFEMPPEDAPVVPTPADATAPVTYTSPAPRSKKGLIILIIVIVLLLAAGAAAYVLFFNKQSSPSATTSAPPAVQSVALSASVPTSLAQKNTSAVIAGGGLTATAPIFTATLVTKASSGSAQLQVEIQPIRTAFTGTATLTGDAVAATGSDMNLQATKAGLVDGSYHWQARTQVGTQVSDWVAFNTTGATTADFIIQTTAPTAPALTSVTGGTLSGTTVTITGGQPTFAGKIDAGNTVSLSLSPDTITLTPTVAADGNWSVAAGQALTNGDHTLVISATDAAGNRSQSTYTLRVNPAAAATTTTSPTTGRTTVTKLAPTGDSTTMVSLLGAILLATAVSGLYYTRRQDLR